MTERQKILTRIKQLMALGDSSFEEEARTSLYKAHSMMREHNVTLIELAGLEQKPREPTDAEIDQHAAIRVREHMRAIGRIGGLKGGPARKAKLSAKKRKEIATAAGIASGKARDKASGY